jgi:cyclopropane fatty-acyl-phospholipid synthase-like methyltransferase
MISTNGFWLDDTTENHHFDTLLGPSLVNFLKKENAKTVVDFGCGHGKYTELFNNEGIVCEGFDGNPNTGKLTDGKCGVLDLSQNVNLTKKYDWVMSLEVGEHIPKVFEDNFIGNLDMHNTKGIIISWAIPGQGGHGHYNEQPNHYIKTVFKALGYINDTAAEEELRKNCQCWWFKNTIMVFRRKNG